MRPRHRPPPWWIRHRLPVAIAAGVLVVVLVVATAAALAPRPDADRTQPPRSIAQLTGHTTGTPPWPTAAALPTTPDSTTPPPAPAVTMTIQPEPTRTHCSRCGERTTPAPPPQATTPTTSSARPAPAAAADPRPAAAAELLGYVNRDRATAGCPPVTLNPSLDEQSQTHSNAQAADDRMYHSAGPTGFTTWGENVAYGYDTAAEAHDGWMGSPPHRANILNCAYRYMGAGTAVSTGGVRYWTEQFAV